MIFSMGNAINWLIDWLIVIINHNKWRMLSCMPFRKKQDHFTQTCVVLCLTFSQNSMFKDGKPPITYHRGVPFMSTVSLSSNNLQNVVLFLLILLEEQNKQKSYIINTSLVVAIAKWGWLSIRICHFSNEGWRERDFCVALSLLRKW